MWIFQTSDEICAQRARREFVALLRSRGRKAHYYDEEIIFGELLGNVARHSPGPVNIWVDWEDGDAILYVHDYGPAFYPRRENASIDIEHGRGLALVRALASEVQINRVPIKGNEVIARFRVDAA